MNMHHSAGQIFSNLQRGRIRQGARSRQGGPPSCIGEKRMGRVTLKKECLKSLNGELDTCSNAIESTRRKRGRLVIYDRPELYLLGCLGLQ